MPARACQLCHRQYPTSYKFCVLCGTRTKFIYDGSPMKEADIQRLRNAVRFEKFYAEREKQRIESGAPSPEELGSQEAKAEVQRIRDLNQQIGGT